MEHGLNVRPGKVRAKNFRNGQGKSIREALESNGLSTPEKKIDKFAPSNNPEMIFPKKIIV
jgi:hypothetical protein